MGTFALLIENASRDIHTLLALHRVHPQVRTDIQRILGGLLRKRYLDMTVFHSKELTDSPEQVCRSIVNNIVEQTLTTALPAADIRSLERRCMYLEEEKDLLESEVAAAEAKAADTQAVLRDLKEAHDYMLHSYFREVLTLRSRIDDLQRQNRAHRAQATAFAAAAAAAGGGGGGAGTVSGTGPLATSMASQLQQFAFMRHTRFPSGSPRDRGSAAFRDFGGEDGFAGDSAAMSATSLTPSGHDGKAGRAGDSSLTASPTKGFMETLQGAADGDAPPHAAALAQSPAAASTPGKYCAGSGGVRGKDRSVRIASPSSRGAGVLMMQTATTMTEVVPTSEVESVDAIFDYEQYVRLLNGERGPWATRFVAVMKEPEGGGRRRRRSLKVRTRSYSDVRLQGSPVGMGSGSGAHAFSDAQSDREQQQQQRDGVKGKGFKFLLRLALEPVQHKLHEELNKLRQAVRTMQKEHARDVQTLGRALLHVQNRSDGLLDFLDTYVRQTQQTMAVLARDSRAQTITDLLSSGALPAEKLETVSTFFSPNTAAAASPPRSRIGSAGAAGPPPPLTQLAAIVGAEVPQASTSPAAARTTTAAAVGAPSGYSRKEWRLKPDVRRAAETRSAAMQAMDRRLGRADTTPSVPVLSSAPEGAEAAKYYRADLGLPFWSAHPITTQAQEVFAELQEVAKEMRVTRVQQLYAFEEAVAAQAEHARRVRVDSPGAGSRGSSFRRRGDGAALEKDADSYYGPDSDDSTTHPPRRLQEGWRDKKVAEGGEATAADLLRELLHLRMRRACDQIRLTRAHETIVQTFYPHLVDPNEEAVMWTKQGKQTLQGGSRKPPKPMDLPPVAFSSAEDVVKHRALQKVRTTTQQRIRTTSQRIAELQRLLELHYAECEVREVVDMTNVEAARRAAAEEASGLYRVNGELRRLSQLWNSPYLNDPSGGHRGVVLLPIGLSSTVDAEGRPSGGAGACVVLGDAAISAAPYASAVPGGGGGGQSSRYRLDESTHQQTGKGDGAAQVRQYGKQEGEQVQQQFAMPPNTPSSAVMDYCRAVQLGVPMRGQGGPVYVFQDPSSGAYFVGGADGQPIFAPPPTTTAAAAAAGRGGAESREAEVEGEEGEAAASTAQQSAEDGVEGPRPPLTMTRILFPAPRDDTPSTAPIRLAAGESIAVGCGGGEGELAGVTSSSVYAGPAVPVRSSAAPSSSSAAAFVQALQPLYLVPMATPLPDEAAAVREGWRAWHQHGHTRQDPIFYSSTAPLPLSSSHHRLVPQPTDSVLLRKAEGAGGHPNKYMSHPPRVFQPPDEAASMVQVKPLRLQSRGAVDSAAVYPAEAGTTTVSAGGSSPATAPLVAAASSAAAYTGHGGLCSLLSDSTNPGVTASPADTAATPPPPPSFSSAVPSAALLSSSVRPLAAPVEHGRAAPWADSVSAISLDGSLRGAASAPAPPPLTPPPCGGEGEAPGKLHPTAPRQRSAKTNDANSAEAMSLAATAPTTSITAAVLVAKQQRAARLAKEAEQAAAAKAQRQEAWSQHQQQRSTGRVPTKKEELMRLPHLAPLSGPPAETAPSAMGPAMLLMPPAANSARLQRQMRPEKYALTPPPPSSSRRAEPAKRSSSAWDLNNDDA